MSTAIDGFQLLKNIGENVKLFKGIETDVNKSALALAKKYLKYKGFDLASLRNFRSTITEDVLLLIFDGLAVNEIRTIVKKVDKYYPKVAETDAVTLRFRLYNLASSQEAPHPKPATAPRSKKSASSKSTPPMKSGAKWPEAMEGAPSRRRK